VHQVEPGTAVRELAVRPVDLTPPGEQRQDRGPFGGQQAVQRRAARGPVGQLAAFPPVLPPGQPGVVDAEPGRRPPRRPPGVHGVVHEIQQAGLDARVHSGRDRAGAQSQCAFPSARWITTACSVTVARSRSISSRAAAIAACSPV
jgi:hypothetical protein